MAVKLSELVQTLGSGARTNKYRVIFPFFGKELDIQCHEVSSPGRSIGVVDVYLKGREYKIAGDRADTSQITLVFYNDPNLIIRNFFLRVISEIQSYNTPDTVNTESIRNYVQTASEIFNAPGLNDLYSGIIGGINLINQVSYNIDNVLGFASGLTGGEISPGYQYDISIQQLDEKGNVASETILMNAWISEVSEIQYTDETGEVSSTELTINYTGIKIKDSVFKETY